MAVAITVNIDFAFEWRCKLSSWWNRIRGRRKRRDGEKRLLRPAGYFVRFRANAQTLAPAPPVALFLRAWTRGIGARGQRAGAASLVPGPRTFGAIGVTKKIRRNSRARCENTRFVSIHIIYLYIVEFILEARERERESYSCPQDVCNIGWFQSGRIIGKSKSTRRCCIERLQSFPRCSGPSAYRILWKACFEGLTRESTRFSTPSRNASPLVIFLRP